MSKYTHSLKLMQSVINVKHNLHQSSYAMGRLMAYMMDNFTDPRTYKDPNGRIITENDKWSASEELVLATREILKSSTISQLNIQCQPTWDKQAWVTMLTNKPQAFKEPVFIIAVIRYLLAIEKVQVHPTIIDHDGTFTEFHKRYGTLIALAY